MRSREVVDGFRMVRNEQALGALLFHSVAQLGKPGLNFSQGDVVVGFIKCNGCNSPAAGSNSLKTKRMRMGC